MGILLEDLTWVDSEKVLNANAILVLPLGAACKEHGPHLKLKNDFLITDYLKKQVLASTNSTVLPTVGYGFYPAFVEYPGSASISVETSRDLFVDFVRSFSRFGVKKFYVLNTGISTLKPLALAKTILEKEGMLFHYTDECPHSDAAKTEAGITDPGTHAGEEETSMMLYIAPETVNMSLATSDYRQGPGGLTRDPNNKNATYCPSGVWGDATREKGKILVQSYVRDVLADISKLDSL